MVFWGGEEEKFCHKITRFPIGNFKPEFGINFATTGNAWASAPIRQLFGIKASQHTIEKEADQVDFFGQIVPQVIKKDRQRFIDENTELTGERVVSKPYRLRSGVELQSEYLFRYHPCDYEFKSVLEMQGRMIKIAK